MSYGTSSYGESTYGGAGGGQVGPAWNIDMAVAEALQLTSALDLLDKIGMSAPEVITLSTTFTYLKTWRYDDLGSLSVSTFNDFTRGLAIQSSINAYTAHTTQVTGVSDLAEQLTATGTHQLTLQALAADNITVTPENPFNQLATIVDVLVLTGEADTRTEAAQLIVEALIFNAVYQTSTPVSLADAIELADTVLNQYLRYVAAAENVEVTASTAGFATVLALESEGITLSADFSLAQQLVALIAEQIEVGFYLRLGNDVFAAWLVNPATAGVSRYDNFPFNSFAKAYGAYFGAAEDGIYKLEGDDDDGTAIAASVKTGLFDLGDRRAKRINDVYLGVMSSGALVLKVVADNNGARTESWYNVVQHGDAANHRAKVGKGLKGIYWGFELVNVNGADFDIDNLQLYPLTLSRRV